MIAHLQICSSAKQCWFEDNATGSGTLENGKRWWDELSSSGPALGYLPNAKKCWLITKPEKEEEARAVFGATAIDITTEGYRHLGAALGSRSYFEEYVGEKVEDWVGQVIKLAEFAVSQPQASYAAFTFDLQHRWTYFLRTLPDIADLLEPLEHTISDVLIPVLVEHQVAETEHDLFPLPVRMGGLDLVNPISQSRHAYEASIKATAPLVKQIAKQAVEPFNDDVAGTQRCAHQEKADSAQHDLEYLTKSLPLKTQYVFEFIKEKGASSWLSVLPLKEMNFTLNKRAFRDAITLRHGWEFNDIPTVCVCRDLFDADHAMICMREGYIIQWHNKIRDLEAEILQAVCTDVEMEPVLQEVTGKVLPRGHPNADSYKNLTPEQIYKLHQNNKKCLYSSRVLEVERGTFTPLAFTTTGGMSDECQRFHSRLAELLAVKKQDNYASTITWIRTRVSFAILRSALVCLRGSRSKRRTTPNIQETDLELEVSAACR